MYCYCLRYIFAVNGTAVKIIGCYIVFLVLEVLFEENLITYGQEYFD